MNAKITKINSTQTFLGLQYLYGTEISISNLEDVWHLSQNDYKWATVSTAFVIVVCNFLKLCLRKFKENILNAHIINS